MNLGRVFRSVFSVFVFAIVLSAAPRAQTIPPGLDLLETDPATTFDTLNLPSNFLPGCDAFNGVVNFRGSPIDCFGGVCGLTPTDTIVRRIDPAGPGPAPTTIAIEIVALELRSVAPITVNCGTGSQTWDVSVSIPEGDPNQTPGTMTINPVYPRGGTFTSTLPVRPLLTFTRVSGGPSMTIGPMPAPAPIIFNVSSPTTWCRRPNPVDDPVGDLVLSYSSGTAFYPGVLCPSSPGGAGRRRKVLTVEQAAQAAHGILPAEKKHHYKCFDIAGPPLAVPVTLQTQFGSQSGIVQEPRLLCPPAIKNSQFGSLDSPHLKCYNLQPTSPPPNAIVDLNGQFGYEPKVPVGPASMLCTPAHKQVVSPNPTPPPVGPPPPSPEYTCFSIAGPPAPIPVTLNTQFGFQNDIVGVPRFLCAPSVKNGTSGSFQEPHLKCYDINPPHDPPHIVNLFTQFGVEPNVPVGPSRLVCIPVNKRPTECDNLKPISKTTWNASSVVFPGAQYNAYKGDLQNLPTGYGSCLISPLPSPDFTDATNPTPGRGFFYLITASIPSHDGQVESTLGFKRNGTERENVLSCSP